MLFAGRPPWEQCLAPKCLSVPLFKMSQKLEGGSPEQKFARHVSQGVGKALLAIEIASPGRDCFAQAVFEKREPLVTLIKGPSAEPHTDKGGKSQLPGNSDSGSNNDNDADADLDKLVDAHMAKNPGMSRGRATEYTMRTPRGDAAYERERAMRLKKCAQLSSA
jgi:hypothetical protein